MSKVTAPLNPPQATITRENIITKSWLLDYDTIRAALLAFCGLPPDSNAQYDVEADDRGLDSIKITVSSTTIEISEK